MKNKKRSPHHFGRFNSEHIVPKGTSNEWLILFAINILFLSGQTGGTVSKVNDLR